MNTATIDRWMGRAKNRVKQVGIELEGAWISPAMGRAIVRDGSVVIPSIPGPDGKPVPPPYVGEIASPPLMATPTEIHAWVKKWYPVAVNETCGLHVHLSFGTLRYYHLLLCPDFTDAMFHYLHLWGEEQKLPKNHPLWARLSGTHVHCVKQFRGNEQARVARKIYRDSPGACRYTAINYPYKLHSTVEVRLLPMMETHQQASKAIIQVMGITSAFLRSRVKKEKGHRVEAIAPGEIAEHLASSIA